jgi:dTDP-4-dehydrorhamnose 3,5-epimerase
MKITETAFEGLIVIKPQSFNDERGVFYESWHLERYEKIGINEKFLQDNTSVSKKNVLRGLHYQKNQGQLVTIGSGRIFDVAVDLRPLSNTYKKYFSIELDSTKPEQLYMPPGFAHGYYVLSDIAVVNYKCTQYYDPLMERGIIWNDFSLGIQWSVKSPIISQKDQNFEPFYE